MGSVPNQVGAVIGGAIPYSNQQNFGQAIGEVSSWNPSCPIPIVQNIIQNAFRSYIDRRLWTGLFVKGQVVSPGYYSVGTVTLVQGSPTVIGNSTSWTASLGGQPIIGQQLRVGFTSPIYTIVGANLTASPQTLTLELPWGMPSQSSTGYFLCQYYYPIPNVKYIAVMLNLQLMFRMQTNVTQALLDNWDASRLQMFYPRCFAATVPDSNGNWVGELWPVSSTPQAFPYLAYVQPPNLVNDEDNFPAFTRIDVIKARAVSDVLLYRPRNNPNYSEGTCIAIAQQKLKEYEMELNHASDADENRYRQDIQTRLEMPPVALDWNTGSITGGAYMAAMSPVSAYGDDW